MRQYKGIRTERGAVVTVDGEPLDPCHGIRNHSPDGFNWGYGGSGPAQLALALLVNVTGDSELAEDWYQSFKWAVIAHIREDEWTLTDRDVLFWLANRPKK